MDPERPTPPPNRPAVFLCPACRGVLSHVEHTLIQLRGELSCPPFSVTTPFTLSATLGAYGAVPAAEVVLRPGALVHFSCPHCRHSLTAPFNDRLAVIAMVDPDGRELAVVFDRVCGEHSSFVIDREQRTLVGTYGEHAPLFAEELQKTLNYFGA